MFYQLTEYGEITRGEHGLDGLAVRDIHPSMVISHPIHHQVCSEREGSLVTHDVQAIDAYMYVAPNTLHVPLSFPSRSRAADACSL